MHEREAVVWPKKRFLRGIHGCMNYGCARETRLADLVAVQPVSKLLRKLIVHDSKIQKQESKAKVVQVVTFALPWRAEYDRYHLSNGLLFIMLKFH